MINIETKTKLSPEDAIKQAQLFFGTGGVGLKILEQSATIARFEGGGGYVKVTACAEGKRTKVELISKEWEYQVKEFVNKIAG